MEFYSLELCALLLLVGAAAGFIDAIAGGGGLLTLPVLLSTGLSPIQALATNKLQGSFGTLTASLNFIHKGELRLRGLLPAIFCTFIGSAVGTVAVQILETDLLSRLVPILLIAFSLYFLFSPRIGDKDAHRRMSDWLFALLIGFTVGFYDGFFGPGTGSFFAVAFVALLGYNLRRATANTKVLNFTSNIASLLFFIAGGHVVWVPGLSMAVGQIAGGWAGSHMVVRHGTRLIRPLLVIVSLAITLKLLLT